MIAQRTVQALTGWLDPRRKRALKATVNNVRTRATRRFLRYDSAQLVARLRKLGIEPTDTLLVHANFEADSGFAGAPADLVEALVQLVGEHGNLLMVSIPFRGSAWDYLASNKTFNVRKTISMMGLVTEMFRRRNGTRRSLHPTHPVLACGRDAAWLTEGHEQCLYPCGAGSPFDKFRSLRGKILFFDVGFEAITFFHHVEDLLKAQLPFPVYDDRLFAANVIDAAGESHVVQTYAFNKTVPRRADKLCAEMEHQGLLRRGRIGRSRMILVSAEDVVASQSALVQSGRYPYDLRSPGGES